MAVQSCTRAAAEGHVEWQREGGGVLACERERTHVRAAHVRSSGARAARGVHDRTAPACLNSNSRSVMCRRTRPNFRKY
eukprot:333254-Prymnesium_polylepis.1